MALKLLGLFKARYPPRATDEMAELAKRAESLDGEGASLEAYEIHQLILARDPGRYESLKALAALSLKLGRLDQALLFYDELIARRPDDAEHHYKRGNALNRLGQATAALAAYDRAIEIDPSLAKAYCNRGAVLEQLARWHEALASFERATALDPADVVAIYNQGAVLCKLRQSEAALAAYAKALTLKPDYIEAHINRANMLQELGRHDEAIQSYGKSIDSGGKHAAAFHGLGLSLAMLGRLEASVECYEQALSLDGAVKFLPGARRAAQMQLCSWGGLAEDLQRFSTALEVGQRVSIPFTLLSLMDSPRLHRLASEIYMGAECPANGCLGAIEARPRRERLRIGYFSADYRNHPVARLIIELIERHDRSRFEVIGFAYGPPSTDTERERLGTAFDRFIDVHDKSDEEVAALARQLEIDIAIDLSGYTTNSRTRIFAVRCAPVQVNYLGYPGTMGAEYMDYLIADATVIPQGSRQHYTEKIVALPHSYLPNDSTRAVAQTVYGREALGLPATGMVYCCFNNSYKITPTVFDSWMRILSRVEDSVLWLSQNNPAAMRNLRQEASRRGIAAERLIFAERLDSLPEHLARQRAADLFLDTWPYNAHATAIDALWAGLPVLTRCGESFASRVAASLLKAIEMPELITETGEQYEELAVSLAGDPLRLGQIRRTLAEHRDRAPLFDTPAFTRHLEEAYRLMYERYAAGLAPIHLTIGAPPGDF